VIAFVEQLRLLARLHPGWYALLSALLLTGLGIFAVGTVAGVNQAPSDVAVMQGKFWLPVALITMTVCLFPHPRVLGWLSYAMLIATIVLLVFLLLPGVPSELAKVAFVLAIAWYLRYRDNYRTLLGLLIPFCIMFVPVALILKQPDLGTAMLFAPALFAMLIAAGAKLRHLAVLAGLGLGAIALNIAVIAVDPPHEQGLGRVGRLPGWMHVLKPHQEKRFAAMMWPARYEKAEAFQQITAMRMIGAGGLVGNGKERARTLIDFNGLPEPHNDMIFAVIVNRWGAIGGLTTMALYLTLLASMLLVAARSKDPFARLACVGFAGMIFTQGFINMGMTMGLLPITGITLPFVSYGGSSLVATYIMIGLTLNFSARRPQKLARPSFEYDNADAIFQ